MTNLTLHDKTIYKKFPNFEDFWKEASSNDNFIAPLYKKMDKVNARWFAWKVYDYWKINSYWGSPEAFFSKLYSKLATDFITLQKKEDLYEKLFKNIKLQADKLIDIKTTEDIQEGKSSDKISNKSLNRKSSNRLETSGGITSTHQEKPISTIDMLAGDFGELAKADFLMAYSSEIQGRKERVDGEFITDPHGNKHQKYKTLPNINQTTGSLNDRGNEKEKGIEKANLKKTIKTQEQPIYTQQIAKIVQSFSLVEMDISNIVEGYYYLFHSVYVPSGEFVWNSNEFTYNYVARKTIKEEEEEEEKTKGKEKSELEPLSSEEYEQLKKAGKPVEKTLILENLVRRREKVKKGPKTKNQPTLLLGLSGLIQAYTEEIIWTDLEHFDKVMNSITGFKEFKRELRNRTELIEKYRRRNKKFKQVFYCLQGKAGVGKTEISTRLAKAYKRPINILGMAGQAHSKILKGMRPTLENAKYGRVAEAFIDTKYPVFKTKIELEKELKQLNKIDKKQLTKLQAERKDFLEKEIKEISKKQKQGNKLKSKLNNLKNKSNLTIEEQITKDELEEEIKGLDGKYYDLSSQAPIILLDEFEKAKDETVLFIVGQMTDKGINHSYYDEFLEAYIDLSQAIILLTSNYWWKVPDFVRSRCKRVNINLLSYKERLEILNTILKVQIRDRFYAPTDREDKWRARNGTFTQEQEKVLSKFSDEFLKLCMTEEFGVRGSIQNLEYCLDFLELMEVRGKLDLITDLNDYDDLKEESNPDGSGIITLTYILNGEEEYLTFDKKRDVEIVEIEKKKEGKVECVLNMVSDWQNYKGEVIYNEEWKG